LQSQTAAQKSQKSEEAAQYYREANRLTPHDGTSHNQLAVLECSSSPINKLNVMFHYCSSLAAVSPGASAAANMSAFFQKHRQHTFPVPSEHGTSRLDVAAIQHARLTTAQHFYAGFIALHDVIWSQTSGEVSFEVASTRLLASFDRVLSGTWLNSGEEARPDLMSNGRLSSNDLVKVVVINIWSVEKFRQTQGEGEESTGHEWAMFLTLRMFTQLILWLAQATVANRGDIHLDAYVAPVRIALQWLGGKDISHAICIQRRGAVSVRKLWNALAILLNGKVKVGVEEGAETTMCAIQPEDYELRGFSPLLSAQTNLDYQTTTAVVRTQSRVAQTFVLAKALATNPESGLYLVAVPVTVADAVAVGGSGNEDEATAATLPSSQFWLKKNTADQSGAGEEAVIDDTCILPLFDQEIEQGSGGAGGHQPPTSHTGQKMERMMRVMAQQRLQDQVVTLESSLATASFTPATLSPFVVVDTKSYTHHLKDLQMILSLRRFVIIVPMVVISGLDDLKKGSTRENKGAREATRFLETVFKQGDANLRAQQRHETADLPFDSPPNISSQAVRILSCCMHFAYREAKRVDMVTLLTGDATLTEVARTAGIHVSTLPRFAKTQAGSMKRVYGGVQPNGF
jgi:hypothetical protein